jgi:hypothetical protein
MIISLRNQGVGVVDFLDLHGINWMLDNIVKRESA